jgi:hypothetical protein
MDSKNFETGTHKCCDKERIVQGSMRKGSLILLSEIKMDSASFSDYM